MVYLRCCEGKGSRETVYPISSCGRLLFGRQGDIQINDELASRRHFVITRDHYTLQIQDLKSTHGTFVNDEKLGVGEQRDLQNGDIITVGSKVVTYQVCAEEFQDDGARRKLDQRQIAAEAKTGVLKQPPPPPPPPSRNSRPLPRPTEYREWKKRGKERWGDEEEQRGYKRRKEGRKHEVHGGGERLVSTRLDGPRPVKQKYSLSSPAISAPSSNLNVQQKKKLLWGSKQPETASAKWQGAEFYTAEDESKFKRLMGVKKEDLTADATTSKKDKGKVLKRDEQEKIFDEVEGQFFAGLRRADGRTVGLGL